jgi:hypothetical protein
MDGRTAKRLLQVAERCLTDPPSRELDGVIYCALHELEDINDLSSRRFIVARLTGEVLVEEHRGAAVGWFSAPYYTTDKEAARTLFPNHVDIVPDNLSVACAAALRARVAANASPPHLPSVFREEM